MAVTTFGRHPDAPRREYAKGKLGIVLPSYALSYQIVAYRYWSGAGMSVGEQEQALLYLRDKSSNFHDNYEEPAPTWSERWQQEVVRVGGKPIPVDKERYNPYTGAYDLNCADDAFRVATFTLWDRSKRHGTQSTLFRNWLSAQSAVFQGCVGEEVPLPALPANAPLWLQQDRAYQQAAWHFYLGHNEQAITAFRKIASDRTSQWREVSRYLIVRTLTRAVQKDVDQYPRAEAEINTILNDPAERRIHSAVRTLKRRNLIQIESQPLLEELAQTLATRQLDLSLRQDLWDYVHLYSAAERSRATAAALQKQELSRWLWNFTHPSKWSAAQAVAEWKRTGKKQWLLAALNSSESTDAGVGELIDAARAIPTNDPAFATAAYHQARILLEQTKRPEAKVLLDAALEQKDMPTSSRNLFLALKAQTATTLDLFVPLLPRKPVMIADVVNEGETWVMKDAGAKTLPAVLGAREIAAFNEQVPLARLLELRQSKGLPEFIRLELQRAALVRSLLLGRDEPLQFLLGDLTAGSPHYARQWEIVQKGMPGATLREQAMYFTMKQPEMRPRLHQPYGRQVPDGKIDDYGENFWCREKGLDEIGSMYRPQCSLIEETSTSSSDFGWLSAEDKNKAKAEWDSIFAAGSAGDFYARFVDSYIAKHPNGPANADMIADLVRVVRYGCTGKEGEKTTIRMWRILATRYAKTSAAKRWPSGFHARNQDFYERYVDKRDTPQEEPWFRNHFPEATCRYRDWGDQSKFFNWP